MWGQTKSLEIRNTNKSAHTFPVTLIMKIWGEILIWVLLITYQPVCGSQDTEIRTKDRRLLLNDQDTLLSHIETLQREMASLTTKFNTLKTEVTTCNTEVVTLNTEVTTLNTEVTKLNTEVTTLNMEVTSHQAKINNLENQLSQKIKKVRYKSYCIIYLIFLSKHFILWWFLKGLMGLLT